MNRFLSLIICCLAVFSASCSYHMGFDGPCQHQYRSISVPFIIDDVEGSLTTEVIRRLSRVSSFEYCPCGGDLILQAAIIEVRDENIGFSYDVTNKGKITKSIIPTETRLTMLVEVSVLDGISGEVVLGPSRLRGGVDFDHEYESSRNAINIFSLGQLSDYDDAYDEAFDPLNRIMARKIVDFVNDGW